MNNNNQKSHNAEELVDESLLNFSSLEELDPKIFSAIKKIEIPEVPKCVENQVLVGYRKHYRHRIFWRHLRLGIISYTNFRLKEQWRLGFALTTSALLFFLGLSYLYMSTKKVEISKNTQIESTYEINYRGDSQENITKLKQAKKFYIEKNQDKETNELIENIYKKVSLETTKIITLDSNQSYDILVSIEKNNNVLLISLSDSLGNYLCSKEYKLNTNNNANDLLETIKRDLLDRFYLKEK